jgi:hypothetical protein
MPRRYHDDDDYDPDDDVDRDPDERYRRRAERYGEEVTDEEEEEEEKQTEESGRAARRKCLIPGLLLTLGGLLTLLGSVGFIAAQIAATGTGPGAGPGAAVTLISLGICAGIPLLFVVAFSGLQLAGGIALLRQRLRGLVVAGGILGGLSVIALIIIGIMCGFTWSVWLPLAPSLLGPVGAIWVMVLLNDVDVQEAFDQKWG